MTNQKEPKIKTDSVLIDLDGATQQQFERYYINGVTVLVDSTPLDDETTHTVHLIIQALADREPQ